MKILCVIDSLGSGGAQNQMVNLVIGLSELEYEIDLVTFYPLDFFENKVNKRLNIKRVRLEKSNKLGLNVIHELVLLLNKNKYDFAISYLNTPNFYLSISKLFCRDKNTVFITSERNTTNFNFSILLFQKKISHFLTDHVFCNSYHEANAWKIHWPVIRRKVRTIYNGIDINRFSFTKRPSFSYKMICVASVIPRKNAEYIIEAIYLLKSKFNIIIQFTWIGQKLTNDEGIEYFNKLNKLIGNYELEEQWVWEPPQKQIEELLVKQDALVLASKQEGVPNVICESLALGLPVFASNTLDHPYLLGNKERGFLFDIQDPGSLAKMIANFYTLNYQEIERMSVNQRNFAESKLSMKNMIQEYNNFFIEHKR